MAAIPDSITRILANYPDEFKQTIIKRLENLPPQYHRAFIKKVGLESNDSERDVIENLSLLCVHGVAGFLFEQANSAWFTPVNLYLLAQLVSKTATNETNQFFNRINDFVIAYGLIDNQLTAVLTTLLLEVSRSPSAIKTVGFIFGECCINLCPFFKPLFTGDKQGEDESVFYGQLIVQVSYDVDKIEEKLGQVLHHNGLRKDSKSGNFYIDEDEDGYYDSSVYNQLDFSLLRALVSFFHFLPTMFKKQHAQSLQADSFNEDFIRQCRVMNHLLDIDTDLLRNKGSIHLIAALVQLDLSGEINRQIKSLVSFAVELNQIGQLSALAILPQSSWNDSKLISLLNEIHREELTPELIALLSKPFMWKHYHRINHLMHLGYTATQLALLEHHVINDDGYEVLQSLSPHQVSGSLLQYLTQSNRHSPILHLIKYYRHHDVAAFIDKINRSDAVEEIQRYLVKRLINAQGSIEIYQQTLKMIELVCEQSPNHHQQAIALKLAAYFKLQQQAIPCHYLRYITNQIAASDINSWIELLRDNPLKQIAWAFRKYAMQEMELLSWIESHDLTPQKIDVIINQLDSHQLLSDQEKLTFYLNYPNPPARMEQHFNQFLIEQLELLEFDSEWVVDIDLTRLGREFYQWQQRITRLLNNLEQSVSAYGRRHFSYRPLQGDFIHKSRFWDIFFDKDDNLLAVVNRLRELVINYDILGLIEYFQDETFRKSIATRRTMINLYNHTRTEIYAIEASLTQLIAHPMVYLSLIYQVEDFKQLSPEIKNLFIHLLTPQQLTCLENSAIYINHQNNNSGQFVLADLNDSGSDIASSDLIIAGAKPTDVVDRTPEQLFQFEEYEMLCAMRYLMEEHGEKVAYPEFGPLNLSNPIAFVPIVPLNEHLIVCPHFGRNDQNYYRLENMKRDLTDLINSYRPSQYKSPVIFFGVVNTDGNHYVPYFIFKNTMGNITIRSVDPSPQKMLRNHPIDSQRDGKEKLAQRMQRAFAWMFPGCDYADMQVNQMLRQRDCGPLSLYTLHDVLTKAGTSKAIIDVSANRLDFNTSRLAISVSPMAYCSVQHQYLYSPEAEELSSRARDFWQELFSVNDNYRLYTYQAAEKISFARPWRISGIMQVSQMYPGINIFKHRASEQYEADAELRMRSELFQHLMANPNYSSVVANKLRRGDKVESVDIEQVISHLPQRLITDLGDQATVIVSKLVLACLAESLIDGIVEQFNQACCPGGVVNTALFDWAESQNIHEFLANNRFVQANYANLKQTLRPQLYKRLIEALRRHKIEVAYHQLLPYLTVEFIRTSIRGNFQHSAEQQVVECLKLALESQLSVREKLAYILTHNPQRLTDTIKHNIAQALRHQIEQYTKAIKHKLLQQPEQLFQLYEQQHTLNQSLSMQQIETFVDDDNYTQLQPALKSFIAQVLNANIFSKIKSWLSECFEPIINRVTTALSDYLANLPFTDIVKFKQHNSINRQFIKQHLSQDYHLPTQLPQHSLALCDHDFAIKAGQAVLAAYQNLVAHRTNQLIMWLVNNYKPDAGSVQNQALMVTIIKANHHYAGDLLNPEGTRLNEDGWACFDKLTSLEHQHSFDTAKALNKAYATLQTQTIKLQHLLKFYTDTLTEFKGCSAILIEADGWLNRVIQLQQQLQDCDDNEQANDPARISIEQWNTIIEQVKQDYWYLLQQITQRLITNLTPGEVQPSDKSNLIRKVLSQLLGLKRYYHDGENRAAIPLVLTQEQALLLDKQLIENSDIVLSSIDYAPSHRIVDNNLIVINPKQLIKRPHQVEYNQVAFYIAHAVAWWRQHHHKITTLTRFRFNQQQYGRDHFSTIMRRLIELAQECRSLDFLSEQLLDYIQLVELKTDTFNRLTHSSQMITSLRQTPDVFYNCEEIQLLWRQLRVDCQNSNSDEGYACELQQLILTAGRHNKNISTELIDELIGLLTSRWQTVMDNNTYNPYLDNKEIAAEDTIFILVARFVAIAKSARQSQFKPFQAYLMPGSDFDVVLDAEYRFIEVPRFLETKYHLSPGQKLDVLFDIPCNHLLLLSDNRPVFYDMLLRTATSELSPETGVSCYTFINPYNQQALTNDDYQAIAAQGRMGLEIAHKAYSLRPTRRCIDLLIPLLDAMVVDGGSRFYYDNREGIQESLDKAVDDFFEQLNTFPQAERDALYFTAIPAESEGVSLSSLFEQSAGVNRRGNVRGYDRGRCTHETGRQLARLAYAYGVPLHKLPKDCHQSIEDRKDMITIVEPAANDFYEKSLTVPAAMAENFSEQQLEPRYESGIEIELII